MGREPSAWREMTPEVRRGVIRWISRAALGMAVYAAILFLPAGTLDWLWGWLFLGVLAAFMAAHPLILVPLNPELLAERERGLWVTGVKPWDKRITTLAGGLMFLPWIVAGLDLRFGWTPPLPLAVHLGGLLAILLGDAVFLWAMASNAFFAEGVRIQEERGHTVVSGGPYRYVRHPGYVGTILAQGCTPFLLGSLWACFPAALLVALFVVRTALEDRTLLAELPGYQAYACQTPFRLLPGVW